MGSLRVAVPRRGGSALWSWGEDDGHSRARGGEWVAVWLAPCVSWGARLT